MTNEPEQEPQMIPIWFFIGAIILLYGVVIAITGVVRWNHPAAGVAMARIHADLWWGLLMTAIGLFYVVRFRPGGGR
jgi:hypothetical protein